MPGLELDSRFTFDAFVVGPGSRLAAAAARRVAEDPGRSYNPLFIYSGSGLGKTHLLTAIGHQINELHTIEVRYETLDHLLARVSAAVEAGTPDAFADRLADAGVLLLDDVQFLAGRRQTQEELIRAWDALSSRDGQVVLTSDRPPQEIDGLDDRLLTRLSGGLIVDVGAPDFETRVAIARRKAEERGQSLEKDVLEALARIAFTNVRELQGGLNRLLAVRDLEGREIEPAEVARLLGVAAGREDDEFGEFLSDIAGTVSAVVESADRRVADAILAWEGEGYRTRRLEAALAGSLTAAEADELVRRFEVDVARLREIASTIEEIDPKAGELERTEVLRDPDRIGDAEALLATVRERAAPLPGPPEGATLDDLEQDTFAVRAARAVATDPGQAYNPLYVLGPEKAGKTRLLAGLGNALAGNVDTRVGFIDGASFTEELIDALAAGRLEAWRSRYRRVDALLVDDLDELENTEGAQEELFHLFEELARNGKQLVFAARVPPQELALPSRLQSRLESGLVVEIGTVTTEEQGARPGHGRGTAEVGPPVSQERSASPTHWLESPEKVLWEWPYAEDWLVEPGA